MNLNQINTQIKLLEDTEDQAYETFSGLFEGIRSLESLKIEKTTKKGKEEIEKQIKDLYAEREKINKQLDVQAENIEKLHEMRLEYKGETKQKKDKEKDEYRHFLRTFNVLELNERTGGAALRTIDDIINEV